MCIRDSPKTYSRVSIFSSEPCHGAYEFFGLAILFCQSSRNAAGNICLCKCRYRDCLLYTSDAADERSSVDLGGRRIINKKKKKKLRGDRHTQKQR